MTNMELVSQLHEGSAASDRGHQYFCSECEGVIEDPMEMDEWYDGPLCRACHTLREDDTPGGANVCPDCRFYIWPWMNSCC